MQDFMNFSSNDNDNNQFNLKDMVYSLAGKFDGKSTDDLLKAIYQEAKKGKKNGTLTNDDIDNFVKTLFPLIDQKKQNILLKLAQELKNL